MFSLCNLSPTVARTTILFLFGGTSARSVPACLYLFAIHFSLFLFIITLCFRWMKEGKKSSHSSGLIYCMLICCEAAHVKTFPVIKLGTEPIKARNKPKTEYCDNTVQVKVNKTSGFFHFFLFNEVNISSTLEDHLADFESSLPFLTIIGMCPNWSMLNIYNMKPCIVKVTAMDYWDVTWRNYDCN